MLAYAAHRRRVAERASAPHVMMAIVTAHIALIAAVMSARMDLPARIFPPPIIVTPIPIPAPPPEDTQAQPDPAPIGIDRPPPIVPRPRPADDGVEAQPIPHPPAGSDVTGLPPRPIPVLDPVRAGPRFATPPSEVRPPYPPSKIASEEEAVLRLRLTIDANGRVIAVDSVGKADPAFLAAARRHLIAHWRYKPATEDGHAMASATLITLRFELKE